MKVIIIIPAYNQEKNIINIISNLKLRFPTCDYIVINNGSTDKTEDICTNKGYNLVNLPINIGFDGALQTGYKFAFNRKFNAVVPLTKENNYDPNDITEMVQRAKSGIEIVISSIYSKNQLGNSSTKIISWALKLMSNKQIYDPFSTMKLVSGSVLSKLVNIKTPGLNPSLLTSLIKQGCIVEEIASKSSKTIRKNSFKFIFQEWFSILFLSKGGK